MTASKDPDELTARDIRRWYHKNGMAYEHEDWGPRSDTGESDSPQMQEGERTKEVRSTASTPDRMWWWENQTYPWRERGYAEKRWLYLLDQFFAPYLAMLPRPKGNLVRQVFGERQTYAEAGVEVGLSRQGAQQSVARAIRDLTRLIALDDPLFRDPPGDGRKRDFEEEARAARRVFMVYVNKRAVELEEEEC
jgi:hypothetical protein